MVRQTARSRALDSKEVAKSRGHWNRERHDRHRDYSPTLGRFIGRDPIGFEAGDNNWYRFVANGPTGKTDSSGLKKVCGFTVWLYTGLGWCVEENIYNAALESGGIASGEIVAGTYGASIGGSVAFAPNPILPLGCNGAASFDGHIGH